MDVSKLSVATPSETETFRDAGIKSVLKAQAASPEQIARAINALEARLADIAGMATILRVDFDDENTIYIDGGARRIVDPQPAHGRIAVHPDEFRRIVTGIQDVRHAMLLNLARVGGDIPSVTRFCDQLGGRVGHSSIAEDAVLPVATTDREQARRDLAQFGYCLVKDALSPEQLARLRARLVEQAAAEAEAGVATFDGLKGSNNPPNQKVWALQNKGAEFLELLKNPLIEEFAAELLGPYFTISHYLANIAGPGGEPQFLHQDQVGIQPLMDDFPVGLNMLWFLDDVCEANGGTRVCPASHLTHNAPDNPFVSDGTVAAEGPAGTALLFDSRLWHGTGANTTDKKRHAIISYFYRNWMRPQINPFATVRPEIAATFDDQLKILHGYRCTNAHGGRERQIEGEMISLDPQLLGREMHLASH